MYTKENRSRINLELYTDDCWVSLNPAEHLGSITGMRWDYVSYLDSFIYKRAIPDNSSDIVNVYRLPAGSLTIPTSSLTDANLEVVEQLRDYILQCIIKELGEEGE